MYISRNWQPHHGAVRNVTCYGMNLNLSLYWINPYAMVYGILGHLASDTLWVHSIVLWLDKEKLWHIT